MKNPIHQTFRIISLVATLTISSMAIAQPTTQAIDVLTPTQGNTVTGIVTFSKVKDGIKIVADVSGLPQGEHGFHIHEFGDCSAPDAMSAGGHFNPLHMSHAGPEDKLRHEGDLGNLSADASGKAHYERTDKIIMLSGTDAIIGRSVVVHKDVDDFKSQPAGNSGARVACGVIGLAKQ
ncbi:MAG TPA: superoxide dismutase family protein [Gammaproteobacteria bacterium]|nr:superoxide dismutase family protein [Gammaproteobacteria bacterium]